MTHETNWIEVGNLILNGLSAVLLTGIVYWLFRGYARMEANGRKLDQLLKKMGLKE